jgi:hypothetical protein
VAKLTSQLLSSDHHWSVVTGSETKCKSINKSIISADEQFLLQQMAALLSINLSDLVIMFYQKPITDIGFLFHLFS